MALGHTNAFLTALMSNLLSIIMSQIYMILSLSGCLDCHKLAKTSVTLHPLDSSSVSFNLESVYD